MSQLLKFCLVFGLLAILSAAARVFTLAWRARARRVRLPLARRVRPCLRRGDDGLDRGVNTEGPCHG